MEEIEQYDIKKYLVFKGFISPMDGLGDACDKLNTLEEVKGYIKCWNEIEDGYDWISVIDIYTGKDITENK